MSKWHEKFMGLAEHISTWSKDPSSKIGSVFIRNNQILSVGYNGFPERIEDTEERLNDRETKYKFVVHAEKNGIYNAGKNGVSLIGSTLYVWGLPICNECAKAIIQCGVAEVYVNVDQIDNERWIDSWKFTVELFKEAGVIINIMGGSTIVRI